MAQQQPAHPTSTLSTWRLDNWWAQPIVLMISLAVFVVYASYRVWTMGTDVIVAHHGYHYQSPFVATNITHWIPGSLIEVAPFLAYPGMLLLPFAGGFRFTCYYFRRAYYRSFVARPGACSTEAWKGKEYKGEKRLLVFQNLHRYFFYIALVLWVLHVIAWVKDIFYGGNIYIGIGTILLLIDIALLGGYVLGCHAFRHLIGGRLDCFSCTAINQNQHSMWGGVTKLNQKHAFFALASMFSIMVADAYLWYIDTNAIVTIGGLPA